MRRDSFCLVLIFLALTIIGTAQTRPQTTKKNSASARATAAENAPPALEPKAIEILKGASDKLSGAHTLSFTAIDLFESLSRQAVPLGYTTKYVVTLERPDKFRVVIPGDGPASDFYCDGKTVTAYAPAENLAATEAAAPTIEATLEKAYKSAAIYFPFTDLIVGNPYGDMAVGLRHAYYIGQSKIVGGTTTDMVAFAGDGIFAQIWVGADDRLPRMLRAVYVNDPDLLRHELVFSDWKLDDSVPADTFTPPPAVADAKKMPFAHPNPETAATKPTKTKPVAKSQ